MASISIPSGLRIIPTIFTSTLARSIQMKERLRCHHDPNYRRKNPSLHYYVWDLGFTDKEYEIEDQFVFLSIFQKEVDPLLLNLLEMWCCLILQTLTKNALLAYIPKGMVAPYAGMHLNVALPIYQSLQGDAVIDTLHGDLYHSNDPLVQRYIASKSTYASTALLQRNNLSQISPIHVSKKPLFRRKLFR